MNQLFYGDNLDVLRTKIKDETVDLCYIDPPFNSKRNYFQIYNNVGKEDVAQAFIDTWTWGELAHRELLDITQNRQSDYTRQTIEFLKGLQTVLGTGGLLAYLVSMTQRINEIWRVLKPTGSFYLHCDPTASHYLKLILDSVFCPRGGDYKNEIIWHYRRWTNARSQFQRMHDVIFFYGKSDQINFNPTEVEMSESQIKKFDRGWDSNVINSGQERYSQLIVYQKEKFEAAVAAGTLNPAKYKNIVFRSKPMVAASDVIIIPVLNSQSKERLGYPTQKPEALLERIIQASSNEGDVVLDAYCGCGTTVAVAERLKRQWIGIDITYQSIALILKRLEDSFGAAVVNTTTLNGIPRDMDSARALANKRDDRLRKEFEKWAVLTYTNNRAVINDKKGADQGIDGVAYIATGKDANDTVTAILQVKSGKVQRNDIATLNSDRLREQAVMGIFITLEEPTKSMRDEALAAGFYHHHLLQRDYPCIQIVTVREMIEDGQRSELPLHYEIIKKAAAAIGEQGDFVIG